MNFERYFDTKDIKGNYQQAIAEGVAGALKIFCVQSPEFKQAVEQSDKTFKDCIDSIAGAIKGRHSASDFEVYKIATEFYFKGAVVKFEMKIDLGEPEPATVSLDSLLDF